MRFDSISSKQAEIFKFMAEPYDALICDGAVRSGKTIMMTIAFIEWAMSLFDGESFGICGKTVRSAERNIIAPVRSRDQGIPRWQQPREVQHCLLQTRGIRRSAPLVRGICLVSIRAGRIPPPEDGILHGADQRL